MEIKQIPIEQINPSPMNPRKTFDDTAIDELAANIEKQGLLQPITVRLVNDVYEIVCGERRYRAVQKLKTAEDCENDNRVKAHRKKLNNFQTISCIVREMNDDEAFDAMITENLQRKDVDPIEEAFAFSQLVEKGSTVEEIALRFGKSTRFVLDRTKLNALIPELKELVRSDELPIAGAMLLSKIDEEKQKEFLENNADYKLTTELVRRFIQRAFLTLENSVWNKNDDDWEDEHFCLCANCKFNTANHGCLFYEMKGEDAKCTNADCHEKKEIAYILRKIEEHKDNLVKVGEPLSFGKTVIIDNDRGYMSDSLKKIRDIILPILKERGYAVVNSNEVFNGQCYYSEDDERIQKNLEDNKVYTCLRIFGYYGLEFEKVFYWVNQSKSTNSETAVSPEVLEVEKLTTKYKRNIEISLEKSVEEMRKWSGEKKYHTRNAALSKKEQLAFDCMILKNCDYGYLRSLGLEKHYNDDKIVEYVKNNEADRNSWYRAFMSCLLASSDAVSSKLLHNCMNIIYSEQYPTDYAELGKKLNESLEKKNKKIKERLDALGYDVHGKKKEA